MAAEDGNGGSGTDGERGEDAPGVETDADGDGDSGSLVRSIPGTIARLLAWIVGPLLLALGAFGMWTSPAAGVYILVGLFVTPRTRRELKELCRIWGGDADGE